eukprot:NODE_5443_length_1013_cov_152.094382_g4874_i0.p1 GENE.NODE_5443_length_1013_cov_152.094382_g4874_i0~~NODE_5443_length_1013_cov_152.094382_g4874_i0.p1  ORF type:complete len:273 (-),score=48.31 NODE_5443_length_1013_cov_152.094382_g4874_i0:136-954(-)
MKCFLLCLLIVASAVAQCPTEDVVDNGYPKSIGTNWGPGFPDSPDCVFQRVNGDWYFFKGTQYWKAQDKYQNGLAVDTIESGYPKNIADRWVQGSGNSRVPDSPDACFQRHSNGEIYFFKGNQYWKTTDKYMIPTIPDTDPDRVDAGYPKTISGNWPIPDSVDGVFQRLTNKIYFFKGSQYYRVTDKYATGAAADTLDSGYPKPITGNWFGIPDSPNDVEQRRASGMKIYFFKDSQYYRVTDKDFPCPCNNQTSSNSNCPTTFSVSFNNNRA